jgi:hypothetical protein
MTNPLYTYETLPTDDKAAMREFDDRYIASIGAGPAPAWCDLGELIPTKAPLLTFPIGSLALKYQQTEGEDRFKTLLSKSFDMKAEEFDVGIEAKLEDLMNHTFAYRNWLQGPARMLIAEQRHRNRAIATLLEAGQDTLWGASLANPLGIDLVNFFSATHLSDFNNPSSTTWSNYESGATDPASVTNLSAQIVLMQGALDENAEKLDIYPDTILLPTAKYEPVKNYLAKEMILDAGGDAATNNPYKGRFNCIHVPEFTDANDWYLVDSKLLASSGLSPWISLRQTAASPDLELRHWDTSSDYFKNTSKIKVSSHIWTGHALGFPHAIRKIRGA